MVVVLGIRTRQAQTDPLSYGGHSKTILANHSALFQRSYAELTFASDIGSRHTWNCYKLFSVLHATTHDFDKNIKRQKEKGKNQTKRENVIEI